MREHFTAEEIARLMTKRATPDEVRAAAVHTGSCAECAQRLFSNRAYSEFLQPLSTSAEPPIETAGSPFRRRGNRLLIVSAALAAAVLIGFFLFRRPQTALPPTAANIGTARAAATALDPALRSLVDQVRRERRLPHSAVAASLREENDTVRGEAVTESLHLRPSAVVVDESRPHFTWQSVPGATYVVEIGAPGAAMLRSRNLADAQWTPGVDLRRGVTYEWQVKVTRGGKTFAVPAPPLAPALFHVVGEGEHAELERLRRDSNDPLLLATVEARAGLYADARRHLVELGRSPASAKLAADLLRDLDRVERRR